MKKIVARFEEYRMRTLLELSVAVLCACKRLKYERRGQGTTEYAILVGVLVVIAIIAVVAFRENLQELWENISESINSL